MMEHTQHGYGPALAVGISGVALLLFGIAASTNAGTVGGVVLGAAIFGAGLMQAFDVRMARRATSRLAPPGGLGQLPDRTLRSLQAAQDHSSEIRAARGTDR